MGRRGSGGNVHARRGRRKIRTSAARICEADRPAAQSHLRLRSRPPRSVLVDLVLVVRCRRRGVRAEAGDAGHGHHGLKVSVGETCHGEGLEVLAPHGTREGPWRTLRREGHRPAAGPAAGHLADGTGGDEAHLTMHGVQEPGAALAAVGRRLREDVASVLGRRHGAGGAGALAARALCALLGRQGRVVDQGRSAPGAELGVAVVAGSEARRTVAHWLLRRARHAAQVRSARRLPHPAAARSRARLHRP
mmetsp:Transcript_67465/g.198121  ORF Transcript_67465/g.198121 Transcript_67465/m.198121 type:complete len:249 (-) Transcript_67465:412-1158(-)